MLQLFSLVAAFLTTLIGSYFIAGSVDHRLATRKKWVRLIASLVALVASFIAIAYLSGVVIHYAGLEFRR